MNALVDQDAAEKIRDLHRQLQEGANFAELAKEHSEDRGAVQRAEAGVPWH